MSNRNNHVCPVERAGSLDSRIRRWIQDPRKILGPYIKKGMVVLDIGCGPGFFSIDMAEMVGESGRVIASDLQEGMLQKVRDKIQGTELEKRVTLHNCKENRIGVVEPIDFALLFYVVHEIVDKGEFFREIDSILKPDGKILIVEPPFHVSKKAFENTIKKASEFGLIVAERPKLILNKTALLMKG